MNVRILIQIVDDEDHTKARLFDVMDFDTERKVVRDIMDCVGGSIQQAIEIEREGGSV